jgi:hypothetical protein
LCVLKDTFVIRPSGLRVWSPVPPNVCFCCSFSPLPSSTSQSLRRTENSSLFDVARHLDP